MSSAVTGFSPVSLRTRELVLQLGLQSTASMQYIERVLPSHLRDHPLEERQRFSCSDFPLLAPPGPALKARCLELSVMEALENVRLLRSFTSFWSCEIPTVEVHTVFNVLARSVQVICGVCSRITQKFQWHLHYLICTISKPTIICLHQTH